jgi:hemerythrin-like domain-containing protein
MEDKMPEMFDPDFGLDLAIIHAVITRAINVSIEKGQEYLDKGYKDEKVKRGFVDYTHCLGSFLNGHHVGEDDILFPFLKDRMPDARFDQLSLEHRRLSRLLVDLHAANLGLSTGSDPNEDTDKILKAAGKILEIWGPHIEVEEAYMSTERMNQVTSFEEQDLINRQTTEHAQKNSEPANLLIPFVLYDLQPDLRARFARHLPAEVKDQMVPIVWRETWESMWPFLLE